MPKAEAGTASYKQSYHLSKNMGLHQTDKHFFTKISWIIRYYTGSSTSWYSKHPDLSRHTLETEEKTLFHIKWN